MNNLNLVNRRLDIHVKIKIYSKKYILMYIPNHKYYVKVILTSYYQFMI